MIKGKSSIVLWFTGRSFPWTWWFMCGLLFRQNDIDRNDCYVLQRTCSSTRCVISVLIPSLFLQVEDINAAIAALRVKNIRTLSATPQIGAHGKPVIFLHPKDCDGVLVELEEAWSSLNQGNPLVHSDPHPLVLPQHRLGCGTHRICLRVICLCFFSAGPCVLNVIQ